MMSADCYEVFRGLRQQGLIGPVWPSPGGYMMGVEPMFNLASAEFVSELAFTRKVYGLAQREVPAKDLAEIHRVERIGAQSEYSPSALRYRRFA